MDEERRQRVKDQLGRWSDDALGRKLSELRSTLTDEADKMLVREAIWRLLGMCPETHTHGRSSVVPPHTREEGQT